MLGAGAESPADNGLRNLIPTVLMAFHKATLQDIGDGWSAISFGLRDRVRFIWNVPFANQNVLSTYFCPMLWSLD